MTDIVEQLGPDEVLQEARELLRFYQASDPSKPYTCSVIADCISMIEALRAESEWRDISTAPRDGTEVDLWCRNISAGSTDEARFPAMTSEGDPWEDWHGYLLEPKWLPTHWKPAPAPPQRNEDPRV